MFTQAKSSPAWVPSARRYPARPPLSTTSGTAHARPATASAATGRVRIQPRPARALMNQREREERHRQPDGLHAYAGGESRRRSRRPTSRRRSRRPCRISTCATSAAARPGRSLMGRSPDSQNSGDAASSAARPDGRAAIARDADFAANTRAAATSATAAGERRPQAERQRLGRRLAQGRADRRDDRQQRPAERDVDRRAGRMRLMPRGIEIAQSQREVDRVDVFERRGERRKVGRQIGGGDQQRPTPNSRTPNLGVGLGRPWELAVGSWSFSGGPEADTFIQAAHPIPLQVDCDVLVADRAKLADDPLAHRGLEARASISSRPNSRRASAS